MTTQPTQDAVPSESPRDLKFNAGKIDEFVTSMGWTYTDRFGVKHYTIEGINYLAQQAMNAFGYVILTGKTFTTGATINNPNEVLLNTADGEYYKWTGSFASGPKVVPASSTPASTGGIGPGAWIGVGDASLRTALAANDGEKYIGECPTIAVLRTLEPSYDKQRITLREYAAGSRKGGGQLRAVLSGSAYTDNGVTVFKTPGGAAWVRINADIINPLMAGALGTGLTTDDDTVAIQRIQTLSGVTVDFLGLTYYTTADLDFSGTTKSAFRNGTLKPSVAVSNVARVHNAGHVIDGLNIDGGFATAAIGYNVDASATAVIIKNCTIKNTGKSGIVNNAFEARIDNNWIDGCGLLAVPPFVNAIYMIANEGSIVSNSRLTRCYNGVYFRTDLAASKTSRNKLIDCFMRGNGQTSDAGAQGVSCQNNANLEISGCQIYDFPNNGIDLQFSDYCHVHDNYVAGCLDGIFIGDRSCKGHNIHNNTFYQCYRGFRFLCTSATYVGSFFDNQFIGNTIVNPTYRGMELNLPNAVSQSGNRICGNVVDMTGSSTSTAQVGIYCNTISVGELSNNIVRGSPQNGIALLNCSLLKVNENIIHDASRAVSGSYDSLYIESTCARVIVRDTMAYGTANYAVRVVSGATNCSITGTRYRSMTAGGVIDAGTGTVTSDNVAM